MKLSDTSFTGTFEGNVVDEVARERIVMLNGEARSAERIVAPMVPVAYGVLTI